MTLEEKRKIAELAQRANTDWDWGYDYEAALRDLYDEWPYEHWEEVLERPEPAGPDNSPTGRMLAALYLPHLKKMFEHNEVLFTWMKKDSTVTGKTFTVPIHTHPADQ